MTVGPRLHRPQPMSTEFRASRLFNIQHETADLSEYDATVTDGGNLSVTADAALRGSNFGLSCLIDSTGAIHGEKDISTPVDALQLRFYVDPNTLTMTDLDTLNILGLRTVGGAVAQILFMQLRINSGNYQIRTRTFNDAGTGVNGTYKTITDAEHWVEVELKRAATNVSSDGTVKIWVDGVLESTTSSIDNFDLWAFINAVRLGVVNNSPAGTSGTFYLDELVVRGDNQQIGA